jgi:hypothetical protein
MTKFSKRHKAESCEVFLGYVEYYRKRYRTIPIKKVCINKNTPVGEPVEFWEKKQHGGRREFFPIFRVTEGIIDLCYQMTFRWETKRWEYEISAELVNFLKEKKIKIPQRCGWPETYLIIKEQYA